MPSTLHFFCVVREDHIQSFAVYDLPRSYPDLREILLLFEYIMLFDHEVAPVAPTG